MSNQTKPQDIIKTPYKSVPWSETQIEEFAKCSDPVTGPRYFMDNFFYIQHPTKGVMRYQPYDYQKKLIDTYHSYRYSISLMPRQTGKSTSAAGYLLWYAMFVPDSTILVAAHKYLGAQEIMQRIRFAYENCPDHIRAGVTSYNKGSVEFENGSRIVAQTTTENTGRGMSISLLYCLDGASTKVKIRNNVTCVEEEITLEDLFIRLTCPGENLSDEFDLELYRKNAVVTDCYQSPSFQNKDYMQQTFATNTEYEILTPTGWANFEGVFLNEHANKSSRKIWFKDGTFIAATLEHRFFKNKEEIKVVDLEIGDLLDAANGPLEIIDIDDVILEDTYEIFNATGHVIVANNIHSHQCDEFAFVRPSIASEFWTSITPTLATGGKCIITSTPNSDEDQFAQIWHGANKCLDEFGNETPLGINGFKAYRAYWQEHPDRDEKWAADMRAQLGIERFRREIGCVVHNTQITLQDKAGTIFTIPIGDFYNLVR